jgi:hypothetical protein
MACRLGSYAGPPTVSHATNASNAAYVYDELARTPALRDPAIVVTSLRGTAHPADSLRVLEPVWRLRAISRCLMRG